MTNAPEEFDLAHELAETADWDDAPTAKADGSIEIDGRPAGPDEAPPMRQVGRWTSPSATHCAASRG